VFMFGMRIAATGGWLLCRPIWQTGRFWILGVVQNRVARERVKQLAASGHDPGQLAWPVTEFAKLRRAPYHTMFSQRPPPGRLRRPGGGRWENGEMTMVRYRWLARQTVAPAGQAGPGASTGARARCRRYPKPIRMEPRRILDWERFVADEHPHLLPNDH
jgi:hypothetical protein